MLVCFLHSIESAEALEIESFALQRNDRFYVGVNRAFVGEPYNWSGVARTVETAKWGTMISPSYFVSAQHFHPANGETLRFYHTNDPNGPYEDRTVLSGQPIGPADLWLGKLSAPVSSAVAKYPVLRLASDWDYVHLPIHIFGRPHDDNAGTPTKIHMGVNWVNGPPDTTIYWGFSPSNPIKALSADGGDSGGSSFIISNGVPTVAGIHWFPNQGTFVPRFFTELNAAMLGSGEQVTEQTTYVAPPVVPTPAPASSSWIVDAVGGWTSGINWAANTYPDGVGQIATFSYNLTAGRKVTLDGGVTLGGIVFNDTVLNAGQGNISNTGYMLQLLNNNITVNNLTLDTGLAGRNPGELVLIDLPTTNLVGHQIANSGGPGKVVLTDNVHANVSNSVGFSMEGTRISGVGNILKTGTGDFILGGDNTASGYTGNIRIEGGIFQGRNNNKVFGTGTLTYVNTAARIAFFNYGDTPTSGAVIPNHLILEKSAASSADFTLYNVTSPNLTWSGNISNSGAPLAVNLTNGFETGGLSYILAKYTGDNSGLTFATGKGFTAISNYIGVGSHNALGAGNTALVGLGASGNAQTGLLATIPTTIASPITVSGNGNVAAAVIGANIASGTVNYTGTLTLNAAENNNVRPIYLRSETGSTVAFSSASVINNAASNGQFAPLTKIGGGRVELNGNNTYIGNSAVRGGEWVAGHANAFGSGSTTINLGEATPVLADVRVATLAPGYSVGLGSFTSGVGNPGTFTNAPAAIDGVTLAINNRILVKDRNNNQNGIYVVSTLAPNVWVRAADLDSTAELAYGQQVKVTAGAVNGGKVFFQGGRGTTGYPGVLTLNSSPLDYHLDIANPDVSILNNGVTLSRNIDVIANGSTGKSILGGVNTSGTSIFSGNVTLARALTLTAANGGSVDFSGGISGGYGITKEGQGALVFSTAKSYSGATSITAGALVVNSTLASSSVIVGGTGTLRGTGTLAGTVTAAGTIAPGNSVGTLTVGATTLTGTLAVEIDGATGDKLVSTGALNVTGATLTVTEIGAFSQPYYVIAQGASISGSVTVPVGYTVNQVGTELRLSKLGTDYDTWKNSFGPGFTDTATTSDPDGDGLSNQQEYAFGLDPTLGSSVNPIIAPLDKTTGTFTYTRRKLSLVSPLAFTVKTSPDLSVWTPASITSQSITTAGDIETVVITLSGAPLAEPKLFIRVSAE
jgi:autotransporter-associated beta strand protein